MYSSQAAQFLQSRGADAFMSKQGGLQVIYSQMLRQASMLSFNDAFFLLCILMLCTLPLLLLMRSGKKSVRN
jgi:DHA2 family multidrug resistance protein